MIAAAYGLDSDFVGADRGHGADVRAALGLPKNKRPASASCTAPGRWSRCDHTLSWSLMGEGPSGAATTSPQRTGGLRGPADAVLTPRGRLMLARRVVDEGWPIVRAAEHFHVSWPTAKRCVMPTSAAPTRARDYGRCDRANLQHRSPLGCWAPIDGFTDTDRINTALCPVNHHNRTLTAPASLAARLVHRSAALPRPALRCSGDLATPDRS
jgi:hypothetical protein